MLLSKNWIKVKNSLGTQFQVLHQIDIRKKRRILQRRPKRGATEVVGKPGTWSPGSQVKEFVADDCSVEIRIGS